MSEVRFLCDTQERHGNVLTHGHYHRHPILKQTLGKAVTVTRHYDTTWACIGYRATIEIKKCITDTSFKEFNHDWLACQYITFYAGWGGVCKMAFIYDTWVIYFHYAQFLYLSCQFHHLPFSAFIPGTSLITNSTGFCHKITASGSYSFNYILKPCVQYLLSPLFNFSLLCHCS